MSPRLSEWRKSEWRKRIAAVLLAAQLVLLAGCGGCSPNNSPAKTTTKPTAATPPVQSAAPAATIRFTEITKEAGIDFTYQNGREANNLSILESLGGGVSMIDYDLDGKIDLFAPSGGRFEGKEILGLPSVLFRQTEDLKFVNVSSSAGGGFPAAHYSHGCFVGDYDNDGFPDFLVTGYGGLQLWRNMGDGTFSELHDAAGLEDQLWSSAAAWGDLNGDGHLDVYVAHYVNWSFENHPRCAGIAPGTRDICPAKVFSPLPDTLFFSNGDGTFHGGSEEAGLRKDGKGLGVVLGDMEPDGDLDIYVANDTTDNFLYINNGHGVFEEDATLRGVAVDDRGTPNGSMGVDLCDYNRDGRPDLWVANFEIESFALYRNDGDAHFLHVSRAAGVTALGGLFVGFGTLLTDLDRDGDEDIIVSNGHVIHYPRSAPLLQQALVLINDRGQRFQRAEFPADSYFSKVHAGRGLAVGDLDDDGDAELVFANNHEPLALLRNDSTDNGQFMRVRLIGRASNRDAVGAWAVLETGSGKQLRMVKGGTSYLSHSDLRLTWGLPRDDPATRLTIHWPSGVEQIVDHPAVGRTLTLVEP